VAHIIADLVKETSTTTGTGSYTLAGAVSAFRSFGTVMSNNDTTFYKAEMGADWEIGVGTWLTGGTLARTTIIESTNGNAAVNWGAGTKTLWINAPAVSLPGGVITVSPSANQNDYNPSQLLYANTIRFTPTASIIVTGLQGGYESRRVRIENDSAEYMVIFVPESTASSAANRFSHGPQKFPLFLLPGDWGEYVYDSIDARWELQNSSKPASPVGSCDIGDEAHATFPSSRPV
jgi:hypothetical protein